MKTSCSIIAALLLASCLFVLSYADQTKRGICPETFNTLLPVPPCDHDSECPGTERCCRFDYGSVCAPTTLPQKAQNKPVPLGCPTPGIGICIEECFQGSKCQDGKLCCSNGCGHQCMTPVPVKPGFCGRRQNNPRCLNLCRDDSECSGKKKCCPNECGRSCENPFFAKDIN
ncbi:WAP four-disulfide core domain protein 2-like isoform X4 [Kryptolebias marmoratus]|uniref:WAP four-disulfide core domain protein 2-like isoform X4 n=1 Tax=Kryptolebias marmoratus TaxID=37003 RepID=UPI0007F90B1A|nr:WAP four-disulfide core domain protein 2-like isoform X4 [Kryptolebias marmoratus]